MVQTQNKTPRHELVVLTIGTRGRCGKKIDMGDGELRADMSKRIPWTLNRMYRTGKVSKHGNGALATRTLAQLFC